MRVTLTQVCYYSPHTILQTQNMCNEYVLPNHEKREGRGLGRHSGPGKLRLLCCIELVEKAAIYARCAQDIRKTWTPFMEGR